MRLRCFLLGLLALSLLVGPTLAQQHQVVVLGVDEDGHFDRTVNPERWVGVGKKIAWMCLQNEDTPKFKLRIWQIKQEPENDAPPFAPKGFEFDETEPCGVPIISGPMLPEAQYKVYKATFEVLRVDNESKTDEWDPHWVVN